MSKKFSPEFKSEAVKLVLQEGVSITQASKDLGIGHSTLQRWVSSNDSIDNLDLNEKDELKHLRKEVKKLRMERDILKKATAFFAKLPD